MTVPFKTEQKAPQYIQANYRCQEKETTISSSDKDSNRAYSNSVPNQPLEHGAIREIAR